MPLIAVVLSILAAASSPQAAGLPAGEHHADLVIRREVIVRVPTRPAAQPKQKVEWKERKGPRCVPMDAVAGAAVTKPESVDIILRGGTRLRAQLGSECPALDYYSGFYVAPTADRQICADRDSIHARSGGECQIQRFRTLTPREKKR